MTTITTALKDIRQDLTFIGKVSPAVAPTIKGIVDMLAHFTGSGTYTFGDQDDPSGAMFKLILTDV